MKYYKRLKIYKNSTGTNKYDPVKQEAFSYGWWRYLQLIEGVLVFNSYSYSSTTTQHQWKLRSMLNYKDLTFIQVSNGLNGIDSIREYINILNKEILSLDAKIRSPRTRKITNLERSKDILGNINKIKDLLQTFKLEKEFKKELDNSIELYNNILVYLNGEVYAAIYKVA